MYDIILTQAETNFFCVEVRNEDEGGDRPATLSSAYDSLTQAPADVIIEWCDDPSVHDDASVTAFIEAISRLHDDHGDIMLEEIGDVYNSLHPASE